jgi:hypothetical protein
MKIVSQIIQRLFKVSAIPVELSYKQAAQNGQRVQFNFNSCIIINQGTSILQIDNNITIAPDDSISIPGELFEVYDHTFLCTFSGGGLNKALFVIKSYR